MIKFDIYYLSANNKKVDFSGPPFWMQKDNNTFLTSEYEYSVSGTSATFSKKPVERKLNVTVFGATEDRYRANIDYMHDVFEEDILAGTPGRLFFNGQYTYCYVFKSAPEDWEDGIYQYDTELTLLMLYGVWVTQETTKISARTIESENSLDYPHPYPFSFGIYSAPDVLQNNAVNGSEFVMNAYGPFNSLSVTIGDNTYAVDYPAASGEKITIDSRDVAEDERRVYITHSDGTVANIYNYRGNSDIFNKIPGGKNVINYSGAYDLEIITYTERSAAKWM